MKIVTFNENVVISDPGQLIGQIPVGNVLPGNYRVHTKIVNGLYGKEVSLLGLLHEDYYKLPKKWNWLMGSFLKTETGRVGIFSKETYQKDDFVDSYLIDRIPWFQRICQYINKSPEKWEAYHRGVAILAGPNRNDFCVYVAKNEQKQIVGFIIDFYTEINTTGISFKELDFHLELNEFEF